MKLQKYQSFNENLNYARSVLRKNNITETSEDFLALKELCKNSMGYLGLLTKLFFIDKVDINEIKDIFESLIEMKVSVSDVINLNYTQLSDFLYDRKTKNTKSSDFKFQFTDGVYDYFQVFKYEGILDIGSPAWCIKTKSNWNNYTSDDLVNNQQWVVIKKIGKRLLSPNTNYLLKYQNTQNPKIRIGITINKTKNNIWAFDDNDNTIDIKGNDTIGGRLLKNINKFNKGEKLDVNFTTILDMQPIIKFDNNEVFKINQKKQNILNTYLAHEIKWTIDDTSDDVYFVTNNGRFEKYIVFNNNLISVNDGYKKTYNPNLNQKIYYELCKFIYKSKRNGEEFILPYVIQPLCFKMGLRTIEDFCTKNSECLYFENNNKKYISSIFKYRKGGYLNTILGIDLTDNGHAKILYILYSDITGTKIEKITSSDLQEYTPTKENIDFISERFGEENIKNSFKHYSETLPKKKSILTKFKNWKNNSII